MGLNVIAEKKWAYTLYQSDEGHVLSVVCGGVAIYELNIPLSAAETAEALKDATSLDLLATKIRDNPNSYTSRNINFN